MTIPTMLAQTLSTDAVLITTVILLVVLLLAGVVAVRRRGGRGPDDAAPTRDRDGAGPAAEEPGSRAAGSDAPVAVVEPPDEPALDAVEAEPIPLGERFRRRLSRTRNALGVSVAGVFGRGVTDEAFEELEEALITADVGVAATLEIVEGVRRRAREQGATDAEAVVAILKEELRASLGDADRRLVRADDDTPTVWLVTGVNGTGKTTSIGKLAAVESRGGRSVVLGAADTFRAAAAEQLGVWAERTGAQLLRKDEGADPASVAYEAYDAAVSRSADVLIVDTAGRLHNKQQLMDELGKVKRVLEKRAGPLQEVLLVLDATTGQNGIAQARAFLEAVDVTGIVLTKLDGSSKGGIVVAVQRELGIPVKLVGLGEEVDDLAPFDPGLFVDGLFDDGS